MGRKKVTYIHSVHAAFPFAILSKPVVSMERYRSLWDEIEVDGRCELIESVESMVGMVRTESLLELDEELRHCRLFADANRRLKVNELIALRGLIQQILNSQFNALGPDC